MVQRVSHGTCKCGAPIPYQGATACSLACQGASLPPTLCERCGTAPAQDAFLGLCVVCECEEAREREKRHCELCRAEVSATEKVCAACAAKVPAVERQVLVLDNETEPITDACAAPPIVCVGFANPEDYWLFHRDEARRPVEAALRSEALLVGHNVAFDMVTICAQWPDLTQLVFETYEADRVTDTMLRERLVDIAQGNFVEGRDYSLEGLARSRCGIALEKEGGWRLRFNELAPFPVESWPEDARRYVIGDVVSTYGVYREQQRDAYWLMDQYRQARYAFVFELMSVWGLHTDPVAVARYKNELETKFSTLAEEMVAHGLMRRQSTRKKATGLVETKLVRTTKAVKVRVEEAYKRAGKQVPRTDPSSKYPEGQVKTDADTCEHVGDEVLKHYADLSSTSTLLSTYVPLLERASYTPLHPHFTTLLSTGRTSSSPNVQNLPTEQGVRECFVPRPGYVYIVSDYAGIELRTWAQICYSLFGESKLREALNAGLDAHTKMASLILGIPYEQAVAEYAQDRKGRVYKPRQAGKAGNFGFPGGAGYARWREYARTNYGVEVELDDDGSPGAMSAKRIKNFWREAWPESERYADWCSAQCDAGGGLGMVEQAFVKRFRGGLRYPELANSLFQGLAADLAKTAFFFVSRACYIEPVSPLYGSRPVNFVHDELVTETPDNGRAHEAAMEQERLMIAAARPFLPDITNIECETVLARRWSKAAKPVRDANRRLVPWDLEGRN